MMKSILPLLVLVLPSLPFPSLAEAPDNLYIAPRSPGLSARLAASLQAKGSSYQPRTEHLNRDGSPKYTNRLILEDSPYLLQHAHNPVDWRSWGKEAFEEARREHKPVFLSIGYSTCHWCHVMEKESFENPEIAALINRYFIPVKVDRERRPDVDATYMMAVMLMTGQGGWPMSSFLTPEGKTFVGGTYFPPDGFRRVLELVAQLWRDDPKRLLEQAERVARAVQKALASDRETRELGEPAIRQAVMDILGRYDELQGGFSQAPKFPNEPLLLLLLDRLQRKSNPLQQEALERTLHAMARGGIYDQLAGGFHRYATDNGWLVPHFEKMLYNQAQLGRVYLLAWHLTGDPRFRRTARQTLDYVLREMTSPQGGFYSATDADSEGHEGRFFLWTPEQIRMVLDAEDAELAMEVFGVTEPGNFEGRSILHLPLPEEEVARARGIPLPDLLARLDLVRARLREARELRSHPLRDDKVVTAWNGMMVTTLALAGDLLEDPRYLAGAARAADYLWTQARRPDGTLWRVNLAGRASVPAAQEDYAYVAEGLLALYDATGETDWLLRAREVADTMLDRFWDARGGGFFMNTGDPLLTSMARPKEASDGAIASGNSVAIKVLARLALRTGEDRYRDRAEATLKAFSTAVSRNPSAYAYMLTGTDELLHGERGWIRYFARGHGSVRAGLQTGGEGLLARVTIRLAPGWHINAHRPLDPELIPTELGLARKGSRWNLGPVIYPAAETAHLGFSQKPVAVYQGQVIITAPVTRTPATGPGPTLKVRLQSCNDKTCLAPRELTLQTPPLAAGDGGNAGPWDHPATSFAP